MLATDQLTVALHCSESFLKRKEIIIIIYTQGGRELLKSHGYVARSHHLENQFTTGYGMRVFFSLA